MTRTERNAIRRIANALNATLGNETMAAVINGLLGCEAETSLKDDEAEAGEFLFDLLTERRPGAVTIALGRPEPCGHCGREIVAIGQKCPACGSVPEC